MESHNRIRSHVHELPATHQVLFWLSLLMLVWQSIYLTRFFGDVLYMMVETPVYPPNECEITPSSGTSATGLQPGEVQFHVDMRCVGTGVVFDTVYVTSPVCGYCGPRASGWNVLSDEDGDGIYSGSIIFTDTDGEALVGTGIQYRYGIGWGDKRGQHAPENLFSEIRLSHQDSLSTCAPTSDGLTYANRVAVTDGDGTEVRSVFGTCVSVPIPDAEWALMRESAREAANPYLSAHVDPWWDPLSAGLAYLELLNPILFLTLCTVLYVYAVFTIGSGYVYRKENALKEALSEAKHKNTYLEHAAKILRHDMHSGINTYIPRGIRSLERRLNKDPECVEKLRLDAPLRMLKEGLIHTQKVYAGVTEFTNLVKAGAEIAKEPHDLRQILTQYLDTTSYKSEVVISELPMVSVNAPLFCTALDNLIRNGLKYNDSPSKMVVLTMLDEHHLGVIDNGRGMSQEDFIEYSKPYTRKSDQKEKGTGLGLNICIAILHEHGFTVTASKRDEGGTLIKVRLT